MHNILVFQAIDTGNVSYVLVEPETYHTYTKQGIQSLRAKIYYFVSTITETDGIIQIIDTQTKHQFLVKDNSGIFGRLYFQQVGYGQPF